MVVKEVRCFGWLREGQGLLLEVCYHGAWFVIPAEKYTHENGVMVYDCIVDHFNQKRMLVTYDDRTYVSSAPISLNSLRNDNTVRAYDLGTCPACFTETDYIVNKYTAIPSLTKWCRLVFIVVVALTGSETYSQS